VNNGTHQSCYITISAESKCNIQIYDNRSLLTFVTVNSLTDWNCRKTLGRSRGSYKCRVPDTGRGQSNLYR